MVIYIDQNLKYKVKSDLKIYSTALIESAFIEIILSEKYDNRMHL